MEKSVVYFRLLAFCIGIGLVSAVICIFCLNIENKNIALPLGIISGYSAISFLGIALIGRNYFNRWKLLNWALKNSSSKPENKVLTWSEKDLETYFEGLSENDKKDWLALLQGTESRKLTVKQKQNLELIRKILNN